jgi:anti-sigma factor RsiW
MDCDTYHELIVADLDGTLSASERDAVIAHLDRCTVCRNARALEAEFAAHLRRPTRIVETPALVRARLLAALGSAGAPATRAPRRTMPAALALGAALLLGVTIVLALARPTTSDFADAVRDDYLAADRGTLRLDVETSDPAELARYFDASHRFEFPVAVMNFAGSGYRLVGGTVRAHGGIPYAVAVYDRDGDKVLCHRFRDRPPATSQPAALRSYMQAGELSLRVTHTGGVVCCLTSRMSADEFERTVVATAR